MSGKELIPAGKTARAAVADAATFATWRKQHRFRFGTGIAHAASREAREDILAHMLAEEGYRPAVERAFFRAAAQNDAKSMESMIRGGMDANFRSGTKSAIMVAAQNAAYDCVGLLLKAGADPDTRGKDGWTPLMWAAYINDVATAQTLLKAGANSGLLNNARKNAAEIAREEQFSETANLISIYERVKLMGLDTEKKALPPPAKPEIPKGWKVIADNGVEMAVQNISNAAANVYITNIFDFKGKRLMTQFNAPAGNMAVSDKRFDEIDPDFIKEARGIFDRANMKKEPPAPEGLI
jgi:hypothetical protein